jgi:hypothetical protein
MQAFSRLLAASSVAVALVAGLLPRCAQADVTCGHCGCVVQTDEAPPRCWRCEQPLYTPAPSGNPNPDFTPPDDFGPMSSGFELGVRFVSTPRGIRVTSVKPGSAAAGVLFVNDIIAQAAYRDDDGRKQQLPTRTGAEMETVKHFAGQSKTALMIRRPSGQVRYAFVVFRPVGGGPGVPVAAARNYAGGVEGGIELDETGEAAALFDGQQGPAFVPTEGEQQPDDAAQDFFNGR